ncbi:MAG: FAD-dependent oxidoreductase [Gammaproteobacteria bacterium]|jgi:glycine/D-amino acid oxidase-like deaminating enzyme/nitrite reductase/ring-hydroxylating ferredoxin subunit|nr:FAD-dependent oxidoreductase [Gammaproteobacteria bacterium]
MLDNIFQRLKSLVSSGVAVGEMAKQTSGSNMSVWLKDWPRPNFPPLQKDISVDVCIIGGGIAGITTAYRLSLEGKKVALIEDGKIASGETGRTTAHLSFALDDYYQELIKNFGIEGARQAAESHIAAINFIENTVKQENIQCDFTRLDGYLFSPQEADVVFLRQEEEAAKKAGLLEVYFTETPPEKTFNMGKCLVFPNQGQFHPVKYVSQLASIIQAKGGEIYEMTHAEEITGTGPLKVKTNHGSTIIAEHVVVATNVPFTDKAIIHTKQEANRSYVIAAEIPRDSVTLGLYWDVADPYHYVRIYRDYDKTDAPDILIIGGEDHRTGKMPDYNPLERLEHWARAYFPQIEKISYSWSGQVIEPIDYLAFIGRSPLEQRNIYIATSDSGHGMTHGTIAGILLTDLILGRTNPWAELYSPSRKSVVNSLKEFASHNIKAASGYIDYLTRGEVAKESDIQPGNAAIVRRGLKKLAVYRDQAGKLHRCSAICSHLQAIVQWNPIELTWDCPAHGSRFTVDGEVLNGPANCPLRKR